MTEHRGELLSSALAPFVLATVHPSSILRAPDDAARRAELARFVANLAVVREALRAAPSGELRP